MTEIDFLFAGNIAVFVGADGVPGRKARDVRGEKVLTGDGHSHLKNSAQEHSVRTLRAGAIHGRDLNAHVIDNGFAVAAEVLMRGYIGTGHCEA